MAKKITSSPTAATQRDPKVTQSSSKYLYISASLVVLVISTILLLGHYQAQRNATAQKELFKAVYCFEEGAFVKALYGSDTHAGFFDVSRKYRFTAAANLACFYMGICYMHQKDYAAAIKHLKEFKTKDFLLQARAWCLIGDVLNTQQEYAQAAEYYFKAAEYKPNAALTPTYLTKAAIAYEVSENLQAAIECYQRIVQEFPQATSYSDAIKHASRLNRILASEL